MPLPSPLQPITAAVGPLTFPTEMLLERFTRRTLDRGELWLRSGAVCRKLAFVEAGQLRHYREHGDRTFNRWAALPGQYTTAFPSFSRGAPSEDAIEATEPTTLLELDRDVWAELRGHYPQLQEFWVNTLEYLLVCFEDRVWSLISGDAEARYRYMIARYPDSLLALPQHYVADMLGIAPRHLSRIRAKLAGA